MATVHEPARAAAGSAPPLTTAGGEPVSVVHVTAEYFPYARTGGLAEAVSGLASFQRAAGLNVAAILPLYRTRPRRRARPRAGGPAVPGVDRRPHRGGAGLPRGRRRRRARRSSSSSTSSTSTGRASTARTRSTIPTTPAASRSSPWPRSRPCPGSCRGPVLLHAHDWHTALVAGLSPDHARRRSDFAASATTVLSVHNPGYQGHFPPETMPDVGLPVGDLQLAPARVVREDELPEGRAGVHRLRHHGEPHPGRELRTAGGGFGLHDVFVGLGDRLVGVLNGIDQREWDPATDPQITAPILGRSPRRKAALQGRAAALVRAAAAAEDPPVRDDRAAGDAEGARPDPRRRRAPGAGRAVRVPRQRRAAV